MEEGLRVAIVNVSHPHYNLGCHKMRDWLTEQGHEVAVFSGDPGPMLHGYDVVALSAIFSWDVPLAYRIWVGVRAYSEVWTGGPGFFRVNNWWFSRTGKQPTCMGLDQRFDRHRGSYRMTFASRGCPVGCYFCIVPVFEGKEFTMDWDFSLAPILCDNNLSALPVEFQEHIIRRYREARMPLLDANSGFEPKAFDEDTYVRWKEILRGPWRYAFDIMPEWRDVERVCKILKAEPASKKRVYVLIGNEPIESCLERVQKVIEWGAEPHCQPEIALDSVTKTPKIRHDWTEQKLLDVARFYNRWLYRKLKLWEYKPRKFEPEPFLEMQPSTKVT